MKLLSAFIFIFESCALILSKRNKANGGGYKNKFDTCDTQLIGSECKEGLSCLKNNCGMNNVL
jgi:hypothetical protein